MRLFKPRRRVCPGQTVRFPITSHDPFDWLRGGTDALAAFEVDGFVTTRGGGVSGVFQKFEIGAGLKSKGLASKETGRGASLPVLAEALLGYGEEVAACARFAERLGCVHRVFVWPEDFPRVEEEGQRLIASFAPRVAGGLLNLDRRRLVGLDNLAAGIRKLRGRSYTSVKPMGAATSNVECYLANETSDPWPGDVDAVLCKRSTGEVVALVEFKTHNRDTPIEEERIGKYGRADWRRFRVLFELQERLAGVQGGRRPRLYYVAWGTQGYAHHEYVKVDELVGERVVGTQLVVRPGFGGRSEELLANLLSS